MALIKVKNLTFSYNNAARPALSDINFSVEEGEFTVLCGQSGCGKSTLLKLMKKQLCPAGEKSGEILFDGAEISAMPERPAAVDIGFVAQNPDNQIVTDKVWHELAFGLEGMGVKTSEIRRRVAEVSGFFGITEWYRKNTGELSGGQKQLLNLASVMAMQPKLLLLDEPTGHLDPVAAAEFIAALQRINADLGMTVIMAEHRLEEVFPIAHKVILMDGGRVIAADSPRKVCRAVKDARHNMGLALPSAVRIFNQLEAEGECPLTVREGRDFLRNRFNSGIKSIDAGQAESGKKRAALEISGAFFRYQRDLPDVLSGLDLSVYENELLCILGGNGAGKTTMLKVIGGINKLQRGKVSIWGKKISEYGGNTLYRNNVSLLPQNPQLLFVHNTVREDLGEAAKIMDYSPAETEEQIKALAQALDIEHLLDMHPYDLSGGEQQKAALAKILLLQPKIILLDEPTKGLDAHSKKTLADILAQLKSAGKTIVAVTHDVEFSAEYADRCAMFFDGQIVSIDSSVNFFSGNNYYTTAASRISRQLYDGAVTCDKVAQLCRLNGMKYE